MSSSLASAGRTLPRAPARGAGLRARISDLQGLLIVGMLMTGSTRHREVEDLSLSTVPALVACDLAALVLRREDGWEVRGTLDGGPIPSPVAALLSREAPAAAASPDRRLAVPGFGWVAVLPLRSFDVEVGCLVVGSRRPCTRAQEAHLLLQGLATQTAAALVNARLHEEERRRSDELKEISSRLEASLARSERLLQVHDRLTRAAAEEGGIPGIAAALSGVVGVPVAVEDDRGALLAVAGASGDPRGRPPAVLAAIRDRAARETGCFQAGGLTVQPIRSRGELLGSLWLAQEGSPELDWLAPVALDYTATLLALELSHERRLAETELRLRRDFTEELLEGLLEDGEGTRARARALGVDIGGSFRVAVTWARGGASPGRLLEALRRTPVRLATIKQGSVAFLIPERTAVDGVREVLAAAAGPEGVVLGIGSPCSAIEDYPRSYLEARQAAQLAAQSPRGVARFEDLGVVKVLLGADPANLRRFAEEWLGPLMAYDRAHRADLVRTLAVYLEAGGNQASAAEALFIHVSTLKYRVQRIREISGRDLSDPGVRFHLLLATKVLRALEVLGETGAAPCPPGGTAPAGAGGSR